MELPYSTELFPVYAVLTISINNEKSILIITYLFPFWSHGTNTVTTEWNGLSSDLTTVHKRSINFVPIVVVMVASGKNKI